MLKVTWKLHTSCKGIQLPIPQHVKFTQSFFVLKLENGHASTQFHFPRYVCTYSNIVWAYVRNNCLTISQCFTSCILAITGLEVSCTVKILLKFLTVRACSSHFCNFQQYLVSWIIHDINGMCTMICLLKKLWIERKNTAQNSDYL